MSDSAPSTRAFVDEHVVPYADTWDREEAIPESFVRMLATRGYLGAHLPESAGGGGMSMVDYAPLLEEVGRGCSSARSLLTVHGMVGHAVRRWGTSEQRKKLLPRLASGERIGALGATEPEAGSDLASIRTRVVTKDDVFLLDGVKRWITFGQIADVFLVLARAEDGLIALLVDRGLPGVSVEPQPGPLGTRASLVAELRFEGCPVPRENLLGRVGFGLSHVVSSALDLGRFSVACGCVGIAQACLEAGLDRARNRKTFGTPIGEHQLIQRRVTEMMVGVRAARALCLTAAELRDARSPDAILETTVAKYFASRTAVQVAHHAVQIHGAEGFAAGAPVQRFLRDARVMEVIEGSTEMQQIMIARRGLRL